MAVLTPQDCATQRSPGRVFRRLDRILSSLMEARLPDYGISFIQWVALKVVREGRVANAGELARELAITTGATTRLIDGLEQRGLIARERDNSDRRVVTLVVTEAAVAATDVLQQHVVAVWNEILVGFDQDEFERTVDVLIRLLAAAERVAGGVEMTEESAK